MTEAQQPEDQQPDENVLIFATPTQDRSTATILFRLDDDETVLTAIRPKQARLLTLVKGVGSLSEADQIQAASILDDLMRLVFDPDTVTYFEDRFADDDDDCDLDVLEPILGQLVEVWFGGPTGGRRGSSPTRKRTGPRSTVRSRSGG